MIHYRSFRNSDPPAICRIWSGQPPLRGLAQPISPALLEQLVLSKPYFQRHGLILATDADQPVGFVHAGFGASEDRSAICVDQGTTCMLMVASHPEQSGIADELLARSEQYLREGGARSLYGGCAFPIDPFYLGLYGGCRLPGILASDHKLTELFLSAGYSEAQRVVVMQRQLAGFQAPIDRRQMQIRRGFEIRTWDDPRTRNWWEACTIGHAYRTKFTMHPRSQGPISGWATFWDMEPLASSWHLHAMGLLSLRIEPSFRRRGLATFLFSQAMRQLQARGTTQLEVQAKITNKAAIGLFGKLGFQEVDQGVLYIKAA